MNIADVQSVASALVGGETVEGLQLFAINVQYPHEIRDSLEKRRTLPVLTPRGEVHRAGRCGRAAHHRRSADAAQ